MIQRVAGWLLAVVAAVLIAPEVFVMEPELRRIALGFVAAFAAMCLLADLAERERGL